MNNHPSDNSYCKNCGFQINSYSFCPDCGAKKITKRITFKNLISEFADRFLNFDNSFVKTLVHLFTQPEKVIDGYINGLRKRYINAFGYFAISLTITGIYAFLVKNKLQEIMPPAEDLTKQQMEIQQSALDFSFQYQSIISFLLIPLLAIISRLVFFNYKKYNLTEHLVIYLYAYSHIVVIMTVILLPITFLAQEFWMVMLIQFPLYIIYIAYVLKRLYQISLKAIILKTFLFFIIGGIFYVAFSILIFLLMLLTGSIDLSQFQPQN